MDSPRSLPPLPPPSSVLRPPSPLPTPTPPPAGNQADRAHAQSSDVLSAAHARTPCGAPTSDMIYSSGGPPPRPHRRRTNRRRTSRRPTGDQRGSLARRGFPPATPHPGDSGGSNGTLVLPLPLPLDNSPSTGSPVARGAIYICIWIPD